MTTSVLIILKIKCCSLDCDAFSISRGYKPYGKQKNFYKSDFLHFSGGRRISKIVT